MRTLLALVLLVAAGPGVADEIRPAGQLADTVAVENVRRDPDAIRGRIVNRSVFPVSTVELLGTDAFLWTDERHPGPDDPGLAGTVTVPPSRAMARSACAL